MKPQKARRYRTCRQIATAILKALRDTDVQIVHPREGRQYRHASGGLVQAVPSQRTQRTVRMYDIDNDTWLENMPVQRMRALTHRQLQPFVRACREWLRTTPLVAFSMPKIPCGLKDAALACDGNGLSVRVLRQQHLHGQILVRVDVGALIEVKDSE